MNGNTPRPRKGTSKADLTAFAAVLTALAGLLHELRHFL